MAVDGTYRVAITSPMGTQEGTVTLRTEGGSVSGSVAGDLGTADFSGGSVEGETASFTVEVPGPMGKMKLKCRLTVGGDDLTGEVRAGFFGAFPVRGTRA